MAACGSCLSVGSEARKTVLTGVQAEVANHESYDCARWLAICREIRLDFSALETSRVKMPVDWPVERFKR